MKQIKNKLREGIQDFCLAHSLKTFIYSHDTRRSREGITFKHFRVATYSLEKGSQKFNYSKLAFIKQDQSIIQRITYPLHPWH